MQQSQLKRPPSPRVSAEAAVRDYGGGAKKPAPVTPANSIATMSDAADVEKLLQQVADLKKANDNLTNQLQAQVMKQRSEGEGSFKRRGPSAADDASPAGSLKLPASLPEDDAATPDGDDDDELTSPAAIRQALTPRAPGSGAAAGSSGLLEARRRRQAQQKLHDQHQTKSYLHGDATEPAEPAAKAKSTAETERIMKGLQQKAPFDSLEPDKLRRTAIAMSLRQAKGGEVVVKEGEKGDECFLVEAGELKVSVGGKEVDTVATGALFGELAVLYNVPRTASVTAASDVSLWCLHRTTFQRLLRVDAIARRREVYTFLKGVKMFAGLSDRELSRVADSVETEEFAAGAPIMSEGDAGTAMYTSYIVKEGQAVVSQSLDDGLMAKATGGDVRGSKLLGFVKVGEYFGERALLTEEPRSATVSSVSTTTCLRIDRSTFIQLLPDAIHRQLSAHADSTYTYQDGRRGSVVGKKSGRLSPSLEVRNRSRGVMRTQPPFERLHQSRALGQGGFGRVVMARDAQSRQIYALKVISKKQLVAFNAQVRCEAVLREKQALEDLNHPFIVSLVGVYGDEASLYFLLELALGGELFRVMEQLDKLQEPMARFYIGSLTLALQHIHHLEYVYRDLKPENVLLDAHGFVKLADFGFAKKLEDRTYTQCGTPDYVAPEMLMGQGVNLACDWWALGVLLHEMLSGFPPFTDKEGEEMKTFANILRGEVTFPQSFSPDVRKLIQGVLQVKVNQRLGYLKGGADDIIAHGWFAAARFDWDGLVNRTLEPPWHPRLKAATDVSYFEEPEPAVEPDNVTSEMVDEWAHVWDDFVNGAGGGARSPAVGSRRPSVVVASGASAESAEGGGGGSGGEGGGGGKLRRPPAGGVAAVKAAEAEGVAISPAQRRRIEKLERGTGYSFKAMVGEKGAGAGGGAGGGTAAEAAAAAVAPTQPQKRAGMRMTMEDAMAQQAERKAAGLGTVTLGDGGSGDDSDGDGSDTWSSSDGEAVV